MNSFKTIGNILWTTIYGICVFQNLSNNYFESDAFVVYYVTKFENLKGKLLNQPLKR